MSFIDSNQDINYIKMKLDIVNLKLDSIIDNISLLKEQNKLLEQKINQLENNYTNELKDIKKDTDRMNNHITFVEYSLNIVRKFIPFKTLTLTNKISNSLSFFNPFKSITNNNKQYLEIQIEYDKNLFQE